MSVSECVMMGDGFYYWIEGFKIMPVDDILPMLNDLVITYFFTHIYFASNPLLTRQMSPFALNLTEPYWSRPYTYSYDLRYLLTEQDMTPERKENESSQTASSNSCAVSAIKLGGRELCNWCRQFQNLKYYEREIDVNDEKTAT